MLEVVCTFMFYCMGRIIYSPVTSQPILKAVENEQQNHNLHKNNKTMKLIHESMTLDFRAASFLNAKLILSFSFMIQKQN